jgi:hypothetical protein
MRWFSWIGAVTIGACTREPVPPSELSPEQAPQSAVSAGVPAPRASLPVEPKRRFRTNTVGLFELDADWVEEHPEATRVLRVQPACALGQTWASSGGSSSRTYLVRPPRQNSVGLRARLNRFVAESGWARLGKPRCDHVKMLCPFVMLEEISTNSGVAVSAMDSDEITTVTVRRATSPAELLHHALELPVPPVARALIAAIGVSPELLEWNLDASGEESVRVEYPSTTTAPDHAALEKLGFSRDSRGLVHSASRFLLQIRSMPAALSVKLALGGAALGPAHPCAAE